MNKRIKKKLEKRLNCFRYDDYIEKRQIDYYMKKYKELHGEIGDQDIIHIVWNNFHSRRRKIVKFQVLKNCKFTGCEYTKQLTRLTTSKPEEIEINFSCNPYRNPEVDKAASHLQDVYNNWIKGIQDCNQLVEVKDD